MEAALRSVQKKFRDQG